MSVKNTATRTLLGVILVIALAYYAFLVFGCWTNDEHIQAAAVVKMLHVGEALCEYREMNGRWPKDLMEAAKQQRSFIGGGDILGTTTQRPYLYFPDAEPGTRAILLAQPGPHRIGLWPFVWTERLGIRADGRFVDIRGDEREVDDSRIRRDCGEFPIKERIKANEIGAMIYVCKDLCKYRERHGRWPQSLVEAAKQQGSDIGIYKGDILWPVCCRPLLYYPDARPGTKAILLAQPAAQSGPLAIRRDGAIGHPRRWKIRQHSRRRKRSR